MLRCSIDAPCTLEVHVPGPSLYSGRLDTPPNVVRN